MRHGADTFEQLAIYGLAVAIAVAIAFSPEVARSGAYETHGQVQVGPRWSNDMHHEYGLYVSPDCVALPPGAGADYVPGRDPWGRPVIPAGPQGGFAGHFPLLVEPEIELGSKRVAGKDIELRGRGLLFDPATNDLTMNGHPWQRDCHPSPK